METAVDTQDAPDTGSPLVIEHGEGRVLDQTPAAETGDLSELEQHKRARGYVKPDAPAKVEQPAAPAEDPSVAEPPPAEDKKPERWTDPEDGHTYDMRHRAAKKLRITLDKLGVAKNEITKHRSEADYWKRRAEELERAPRQETTPQQPNPAADDPEPDPADTTKYPEGQFDRAFIRDQARWAARQETNARFSTAQTEAQAARRAEAERAAVDQWNQHALPEARKRYADFDAVLAKFPNTEDNRDLVDVMLGSPVGNDVVHAIGTHQELYDAYHRAPNAKSRQRLIYHVEAQLILAQRSAGAKVKESKTNAPPPTEPVHTGGSATGVIDWSKSDDPDQYQRWKSQRGSRR